LIRGLQKRLLNRASLRGKATLETQGKACSPSCQSCFLGRGAPIQPHSPFVNLLSVMAVRTDFMKRTAPDVHLLSNEELCHMQVVFVVANVTSAVTRTGPQKRPWDNLTPSQFEFDTTRGILIAPGQVLSEQWLLSVPHNGETRIVSHGVWLIVSHLLRNAPRPAGPSANPGTGESLEPTRQTCTRNILGANLPYVGEPHLSCLCPWCTVYTPE
jgi:hypothetical protein